MELTSTIYAGVFSADSQKRYGGDYSLENPNLPLNDPGVWQAVFNDSFGTDSGVAVTEKRALMYAPFYRAVHPLRVCWLAARRLR